MRKLAEVENAKALMSEAKNWSVVKWLSEKKRVRKTADLANAALDRLDQDIKERWGEELKAAYRGLGAKTGSPAQRHSNQLPPGIDGPVKLLAQNLKKLDDEAYRARMEAEATFDEAEKKLSTRLAREGCQKAIDSWDLHEQAIHKSEGVIGATKA